MLKKILLICTSVLLIINIAGCNFKTTQIDKNKQKKIMDVLIYNQSLEESPVDGSIDWLPTVQMGSYKQNGNSKSPIDWVIVRKTNDAALLISKYIIDVNIFDKRSGCFWQNSELRAWLNNEFYNEAFDASEKDLILNTIVPNRNTYIYTGPGTGFYGNGEDTVDKCFIFNTNDWWQYDKTALKYQKPTEYVKNKKENVNSIWTRAREYIFYLEPGNGPGGGDSLNTSVGNVNSDVFFGVRPCIWIKRNDADTHNFIFENGYILRDQMVIDGYERYYLGNDGNIQKNVWVNNKYYGADGKMAKNMNTPDGKYVNHNGDPVIIEDELKTIDMNNVKSDTWVITDGGIWFYVENDRQTMKKGWFEDPQDKQTYYLDEETGIMATGWREIKGKKYYFCEEQAKVPNWYYESTTDTWLSYGIDIKSYGSMYRDEMTPDGQTVGKDGSLVKK